MQEFLTSDIWNTDITDSQWVATYFISNTDKE